MKGQQQKYAPKLTQERDYPLLHQIYRYDGMLSYHQVQRWFFPEVSRRRMEIRIKQLCDGGYLRRALKDDARYQPPEPIVWLGRRGADALAAWLKINYGELKWRNQPKSSRIAHDIALNEFRYKFEQAVEQHANYELERWWGQDELSRVFTKSVAYLEPSGKREQKIYRADGLVSLKADTYRLHCPLEYDNNTFRNHQRFGREKVSPGVHWMLSADYQREIGVAGRFLVVVAGTETHFHNMRSEVTKMGGAGYHLFVRDEGITADTVLSKPIWYLSHLDEPFSFEDYDQPAFQAAVEKSLKDPQQSVPRLRLLPRS